MPNNEKNAEPAVRDAQSTAARRRRRRHTPHGDAPAQNPAPRAPQPKDASRPCPPRQAAPNNRSNAAKPAALKPAQRPARPNNANQARPVAPQLNGQPPRGQQKPQPTPQPPRRRPPQEGNGVAVDVALTAPEPTHALAAGVRPVGPHVEPVRILALAAIPAHRAGTDVFAAVAVGGAPWPQAARLQKLNQIHFSYSFFYEGSVASCKRVFLSLRDVGKKVSGGKVHKVHTVHSPYPAKASSSMRWRQMALSCRPW